ncbi:MAG: hypothetical protein NZ699_17695 [Roseiflexus sp.]|nr:hypothetical protein [Roseiflexus sp.]MCS7290958.1 hypothetical protein [Roseiflexus sp.]MDW8147733.1 hypothetical protein [Roseiflexaceae bacterium]
MEHGYARIETDSDGLGLCATYWEVIPTRLRRAMVAGVRLFLIDAYSSITT